ncbi:MAG: thioesterase family protein [Rhodospirillaceae bacterium]
MTDTLELPAVDLTDRASYAFFTSVTTRYSDQDEIGHINNCSYAAYIEVGRVQFLGGLVDPAKHPGIDFLLARLVIDYRREAHYPGTVEVGTRVLKLGNKSMTTGYGVFKDGHCIATAESVNVFFLQENHATIPIPADIRAALAADPTQAQRAGTAI